MVSKTCSNHNQSIQYVNKNAFYIINITFSSKKGSKSVEILNFWGDVNLLTKL